MNTPQDNRPDFELTKYDLDRAHELELNKFAHALEIERLKILQLVNGGAFTVLVVFAPGLLRSLDWPRWLAISAAISWVLGLGVAAWATQRQLEQQGQFNSAYRLRRNAIEWRRLSKRYNRKAATLMIPPLQGEAERDKEMDHMMAKFGTFAQGELYDAAADRSYFQGKAAGKHLKHWAMASIGFFVLGALLLTVAVSNADPRQFEPTQKAAR